MTSNYGVKLSVNHTVLAKIIETANWQDETNLVNLDHHLKLLYNNDIRILTLYWNKELDASCSLFNQ